MKTRISALMDGELEAHECSDVFRALRRDGELRSVWSEYQIIGGAMRGEGGFETDLTARVMASLDEEPTVLAPRPRRPVALVQSFAALAASVCGVAVVAWLALGPESPATPAGSAMARGASAVSVAQGTPVVAPVAVAQVSPRLQEYLVAHGAYSGNGAMVGGARNIRNVAFDREGR